MAIHCLSSRLALSTTVLSLVACGPNSTEDEPTGSTSFAASGSETTTATEADPTDGGDGTGDGSTTTSAPSTSCLPPQIRGSWIAMIAGMNVFAAVHGDRYMLEHPGAHFLDPDQLLSLYESKEWSPLLDEVAGFSGVGYGLCVVAPIAGPNVCINVYLATHTSTIDTLATQLAASIGDVGDVCFGVSVELLGLTAPRCEADDPECAPIGPCEEAYDPKGPRAPLPGAHEGACSHDGDCFLNGCGDHCDAWTVPGFIGACSGTDDCSLCGCVEGLCQWFLQGDVCPAICV